MKQRGKEERKKDMRRRERRREEGNAPQAKRKKIQTDTVMRAQRMRLNKLNGKGKEKPNIWNQTH